MKEFKESLARALAFVSPLILLILIVEDFCQ